MAMGPPPDDRRPSAAVRAGIAGSPAAFVWMVPTPAPDLISTMQRIAAMAAEIDKEARRPDDISSWSAEAILEELSGASPTPEWRFHVGADKAALVCLAKAVRLLASMLAAREGVTIPNTGILDDMTTDSARAGGGGSQAQMPGLRPFVRK